MRLGDGGDNFDDRTGQSGGGFGLGGGGGNMLGCLLPLVASRFGLVGVAVLLLGYCALTQLGGGGGLIPSGPGTTESAPSGQSKLSPENRRVLSSAVASTDAVWGQIFTRSGARYTPARLVAYTRGTQTACGAGQAAMGPFYCPNDQRIYIDPEFFTELSRRFGAPGDFAQYYVIAHEVGHHIQNLEGTLDKAQSAQSRSVSNCRPTATPVYGLRTPRIRKGTAQSSPVTSRKACGRPKRSATTPSNARRRAPSYPKASRTAVRRSG